MKNVTSYSNKINFMGLALFKLIVILIPFFSFSQTDTTVNLTFDFNDHQIKEKDNKVIPKYQVVAMAYDRFGNKKSAVEILGHNTSYLNLGTSDLVKTSNISISIWVKIIVKCLEGKGSKFNPILIVKNGPGYDWVNALSIAYDLTGERFAVCCTKDSLDEVAMADDEPVVLNKWYHLVMVCNNQCLGFYVNGELIGKAKKDFETKFLESDSLVIGHSASTKNLRFLSGIVDDIKIFHKPLSDQEVLELYNAPNPNAFKNFLNEALKYLLIIFALIVVIILLIIRNRRTLKKQKDELELDAKIAGFELKAVKAQMNPHFVSNCLAAIQDLIYKKDFGKAGHYIAKFSFFLRQILNYSDENYLTLNQELEMIKLFTDLEKLRFSSGFQFEAIIDDDVNIDNLLIPSLITQPFVENAIWHGLLPLKGKREPWMIIRVKIKNGVPVLEIEDNGVGRDLSKKQKTNSKGTQLVLDKINTLNRLSKTSSYKIEIIDLTEGTENKGTKVIIYLDNTKE